MIILICIDSRVNMNTITQDELWIPPQEKRKKNKNMSFLVIKGVEAAKVVA